MQFCKLSQVYDSWSFHALIWETARPIRPHFFSTLTYSALSLHSLRNYFFFSPNNRFHVICRVECRFGSRTHRRWRLRPWLVCTGRRARPVPCCPGSSSAPWPPPLPSRTIPARVTTAVSCHPPLWPIWVGQWKHVSPAVLIKTHWQPHTHLNNHSAMAAGSLV